MFGLRFIKADPTTYLMQIKRGQIVCEGVGQSFYYYAPTSSLVAVPVGSQIVPYIFSVKTADFQEVTVQGSLSYRIAEPKKIASMLNFTLKPNGRGYLSDDPQNLHQRIEGIVEVLVQQTIKGETLRTALQAVDKMVRQVDSALRDYSDIVALGIEILSFSIVAVKPHPETARALEAGVREQILKEADDALYARRNAAVENERSIKESELDTEIAVELKQRTIQETKIEAEAALRRKQAALDAEAMEAQIELEGRRREFVVREAENTRTMAEADAHRLGAVMQALQQVDPKVIQSLATVGMAPSQLMAIAFGGLAENAGKIGQLNLSPDLLEALMHAPVGRK